MTERARESADGAQGVRPRVLTCLRVARASRLVEAGLVAFAVLAFVPAAAVWSSGREPIRGEWVLAILCAGASAFAWIVARQTLEADVVSMIDDKIGAEGEWRTAWEIETGRLKRTALSEELLRRAPRGVTRQDLRDVVPPAALPLLALPFLAAGAYAFTLDHVRGERRTEFEWTSVARGLGAGGMRAAIAPSGAGAERSPMSPLADEMFREAVRAGTDLEQEMSRGEIDPETVRAAIDRSEEALDRFEAAAGEDGSLTPEVEAVLAERRTLLDAARLQLDGRDPAPADGAAPSNLEPGENRASSSPAEPSPGTIAGPLEGGTGPDSASSASGTDLPAGAAPPGAPANSPRETREPEQRTIPPVLPGRSFEARYDGVVTRFVQSMTRSAD